MIVSNGALSNPANITPPMRASLFYAAKQAMEIADVMKSTEFLSEYGRAKCFFWQSSKPNELFLNTMFHDTVCLKGPQGLLIRVLVSECDDCEDCVVTNDIIVT